MQSVFQASQSVSVRQPRELRLELWCAETAFSGWSRCGFRVVVVMPGCEATLFDLWHCWVRDGWAVVSLCCLLPSSRNCRGIPTSPDQRGRILSVAENPELTLTIGRFNFDWRCDGDVVARCHSQSDKSITPARMTERSLSFSLTTKRQNNSGSENLTTQITAQRPIKHSNMTRTIFGAGSPLNTR